MCVKPNCAPKPQKLWQNLKANAKRTSSCSAKSAKRSPPRWISTRFFTGCMSTSINSLMRQFSASAFIIREKRRSNIALPLKKANATRHTPAIPATRISFRCGALKIAGRCLSMMWRKNIAAISASSNRPMWMEWCSKTARFLKNHSPSSICRSSRRKRCWVSSRFRVFRKMLTRIIISSCCKISRHTRRLRSITPKRIARSIPPFSN